MPPENHKKIIGLLGVGFDADDGHIRISKGEKHNVLMGSDESHEYLQKLIAKIEVSMKEQGVKLDDFTPQQFGEFVKKII